MAPKGRKRAAASQAGNSAKRSNADPVDPKCSDVCAGIELATSLPKVVKDMLVHNVRQSLNVFAADRHAYQVQAIQMVKETLAAVQEQLQGAVNDAQAKVDSADREKASRNAQHEGAQAKLTDLEESSTTAKAKVEEDTAAVATAKESQSNAALAFKDKEGEVSSMSDQKSTLETTMKDVYEPMKTSKAGVRALNTLTNVFRDAGLEAGLIDCLPDTFKKEPAERRTFDALVVKHVEKQTAQYITQTEQKLKDAEVARTDLANAKAAAEEAFTAAQQKLADSQAALKAAKESLKDGKEAAKSADGAISNFDKEITNAAKNLEQAKAALTSFNEGAMQSFEALKDLTEVEEPAEASEMEAQEE